LVTVERKKGAVRFGRIAASVEQAVRIIAEAAIF
jgi:hypothetical protein